jgi:hypothetical protein
MQHKDIKRQIRKQLKTQYPFWRRLTKKEKKAIAREVFAEVTQNYDFSSPIKVLTSKVPPANEEYNSI